MDIGGLVRRFYLEVVPRGDLARLGDFIGPDYLDWNAPDAGRGPEVVRAHLQALRTTFPDLVLVIEDLVAGEDRVVTRVSGRGTHRGEWLGVHPTFRVVTLRGINIDRVARGRIVEHWGEADTIGMLMQMGVDPFVGRLPGSVA